MLAINHVTLSTATVLAGSIYFNKPFFLPFIILVIFAGLLPDVDHSGSEISRFFPGVNRFFGHRTITHSLLANMVFGYTLFFLVRGNYAIGLLLIIFSIIGVTYLNKLLNRRIKQLNRMTNSFLSRRQIGFLISLFNKLTTLVLILSIFVIYKQEYREQMVALLTIGYFSHLVGDFLTKDGIPIFYPIKNRFGLKLFRTGGKFEEFVGFLLVVINLMLLVEFWQVYELGNLDYWQSYLIQSY